MKQISDSTDVLHPVMKKEEVTNWDFFWIVVSIILFSGYRVMDIILAVNYFQDGKMWFFGLTVSFVIIPALILAVFNQWMYEMDAEIEVFKVSTKQRIVRTLLIFLLMAPLLKNFEALYYGIKSCKNRDDKKKKLFYLKMKLFIADAAIITVLEAFMECGPQAVLQLYFFAQSQVYNPNIITKSGILQLVSIFISLLSMSATYATYQHSMRSSSLHKAQLNIPRMLFLILWRFFDITSRVIALGLLASVFPYYLLLFCGAHFIIMFAWIWTMRTSFYGDNKCRELLYNLVLGEVFIFIFFNPKDQKTGRLYTIFYSLMFYENAALICVWYYFYSPVVNLKLPALILQFSSFVLAVILMVIYYYFLHPTVGKYRQKHQTVENPKETVVKAEKKADEKENLNAGEPDL